MTAQLLDTNGVVEIIEGNLAALPELPAKRRLDRPRKSEKSASVSKVD